MTVKIHHVILSLTFQTPFAIIYEDAQLVGANVEHDLFEGYQVTIENTNQLRNQRQGIDTLLTTITTFILGADAYVASHSKFNNWFAVILAATISLVGLAFTLYWQQVSKELTEVLRLRYNSLRDMEANQILIDMGVQMYRKEDELYKNPRKGIGIRIKFLQTIFLLIFILIPVFLALLTLLAGYPWFNQFIQPLT